MIPDWRYWRFYYANSLLDLKDKYRKYGWKAFVPHRHIPKRIPAADGWYCRQCGTRKAVVQTRGMEEAYGRH